MNLKKKNSIEIAIIILILSIINNAFGHIVGYGSADSVLPAKNQEAFFTGFELGMREILGEKKTKEILTVEQVANGSPAGSLKALKTLKDRNVKMISGFPTSHEAVQVAKVTSQEGYLTIFASAGHSSLSEFGSTVFTTGESMRSYVTNTTDLIRNRFKGQNGIFIYNPQALFSMNQKNEFEKYFLESKDNKIPIEFVSLNANLKLDPEHINQFKKGKYQYIFLSPYADECAGILNQLATEKIDLPMISNSSWTTGDIELVRRVISEKKAPILTGAVWVPGMETSKYFEKFFAQKYGAAPTPESASGYDLGVITGTVIQRAKGKYSKESLVKAFHSNLCFEKTTVGKICFPEKGGHGSKPIIFMQLTKSGLKQL